MGSRRDDLRARAARPGTYYLTRGWLDAGHHPLGQYHRYLERHGREEAGHLVDAMYGRYTDLVFLAASDEELRSSRPGAGKVARFCRARWGMRYSEAVGAPTLIEGLLAARPGSGSVEDLLVVPPGGPMERSSYLQD